MIPPSSKRPPGQKEERVMADRITPQAPDKSDSSATKTAAARISKKKMSKKKMSKKKMSK
jgi:hypothetical protein